MNRLSSIAAAVAITACAGAMAQEYPSRPIKMVTQFTAGSGGDALTRILTSNVTNILGQPVVIENRAGAGGVQAAEAIAHAAPDGYTIGALTPNVPEIRVVAGTKISIDPVKDLVPVTAVGGTPSIIIVNPSAPVKNLKELIDYAKRYPNKLSFGTSGVGSAHHLAYEQMHLLTGMQMVHVPYKAGQQAMLDVVTGIIPVGFVIVGEAGQLARAGKVRLIATREDHRLADFPDVPTVAELIPGFEPLPGWTGIFSPKGVPAPIFKRLAGDLIKALRLPDTKDKMQKIGFDPIANTPEEFAAEIKREIALTAKLVKAGNIKLD